MSGMFVLESGTNKERCEKSRRLMVDEQQERMYSNGMYTVIKRTSEYGICYSVVRWGSVFFERTFDSLIRAVEWCDRRKRGE